MTTVTIDQITSKNIPWNAFLNVVEAEGSVAVWGNTYNQPTFLLTTDYFSSNTFMLICFDNEICAKEWLENNKDKWKVFMNLTGKLKED
jgi:hypothetical protein